MLSRCREKIREQEIQFLRFKEKAGDISEDKVINYTDGAKSCLYNVNNQ